MLAGTHLLRQKYKINFLGEYGEKEQKGEKATFNYNDPCSVARNRKKI